MAAHLIAYDLYAPGQNYEYLINKINKYPDRVHLQQSVWVIQTYQSSEQVKKNLQSCLDQNDKLLVAELIGNIAFYTPQQQSRKTMLTGL